MKNYSNFLKKFIPQALALFIAFFLTFHANADHTAGGEITYRCLGGSNYEITVKVYRDCDGAASPGGCSYNCGLNLVGSCGTAQNPLLVLTSSCGGCKTELLTNPVVKEVTPICPTQATRCQNSSSPWKGIQEYTYKVTVSLAGCNNWNMQYSNYARNASITNVNNPSTIGMRVTASINTSQGCNSTVDFKNKPVPWTCVGSKYCFNNGGVEPDGDSLVYDLISPKTETGANVSYKAGFSPTNPITSSPAMSIDPTNGDVCITPTKAETTIFAVRVREYRNGVLVGTTVRDIQLTVINCSNFIPEVTNPTITNGVRDSGFYFTICALLPTTINFPALDTNQADKIGMSWLNGIPGATFTVNNNNTKNTAGVFAWTPPAGAIGTSPHSFQILLNDDHCPYIGTNSFAVTINVVDCPITAEITADTSLCINECVGINVFNEKGGKTGYTYTWDNGWSGPGPHNICPQTDTTISVIVGDSVGSTPDTVEVNVFINQKPNVNAGIDAVICYGDSTTLSGSGAHVYSWTPLQYIINPSTFNPIVFPRQTMDYYLNGIDTATGCENDDTVNVFVNPTPITTISNDTAVCPNQSVPLFATGGTTYLWQPGRFLNDSTISNPISNPSAPITYTVFITNSNGCDTFRIVNVGFITGTTGAQAGNDTAICIGDTIQFNGSGGNTYAWSPGISLSDTTIPTPLAYPSVTTIYSLYIVDLNGCIDSTTKRVSVNGLPNASAGPDLAECEGVPVSLFGSGGVTYNWSPGNFLNDSTIPNPAATLFADQEFTLTIEDANNCVQSDTMFVTINSSPVVNAGTDTSICTGGSAVLEANPAGFVYYKWTDPSTLTNPNNRSTFATPSQTTIYTIEVSDNLGCLGYDSVTVNLYPAINAEAGPNDAICFGETAQLNGGPAGFASYTWSPVTGLSDPNISNPIASPSNTTFYTLTITDFFGCSETDFMQLTVNQLPTANAGSDLTICSGSQGTFNGSGGVNYEWFPKTDLNNGFISNPTVTANLSRTYTLEVTDNNGCMGTDSADLTVLPLPTVDAGSSVGICPFDSTQLNGTASPGVSYQWTPAGSLSNRFIPNPVAKPSSTTTYTLKVTDANGCSNTDQVTVTVFAAAVADAGMDASICLGDNYVLQGNPSNASTFKWSPSGSLNNPNIQKPTATPVATTKYKLEITDNFGCIDSSFVNITVNQNPVAFADGDTTICENDSAYITSSGGVTYMWTPNNGSIGNASNSDTWVFPTTSTQYTVLVTDINGCDDTASVTIMVNPTPQVNAGLDATICKNDTVQLNGSTNASNHQWIPSADVFDPNALNTYAIPSSSTSFALIATDNIGCTNFDIKVVTVNALPNVDAGPDEGICIGASTQLNGSGAVNYTWTPQTGLATPQSAQTTANPSTTTIYKLVGEDANGCLNEDYITVRVNPLPVITLFQNDTIICPGDKVRLISGGGVNYQWNPAAGLNDASISDPIAQPTSFTVYTLTVTNDYGCVKDTTVSIDLHNLTPLNLREDTAICPGGAVQMYSTPNLQSYFWIPGSGLNNFAVSNPLATPSQTTDYTLTVLDLNGCYNQDNVKITVFPEAYADAGEDQIIDAGHAAYLQGSGGGQYIWSPNNGSFYTANTLSNPIVRPDSTTIYTLLVISDDGCVAEDEVLIEVIPEVEVQVPSGFTPNNDGRNDQFRIYYQKHFFFLQMEVYNRWGELVWVTQRENDFWDGTFNGINQPVGTYVWVIKGLNRNTDETIQKQGSVTLLR